MEFHRGRLIDHVHLVCRDLEASKRFYRAVLGALGVPVGGESGGHFWADELFLTQGEPISRIHLAFQADGVEAVKAFFAAATATGGQDNGAPGERPYHPGYYAAYVLDPDGNNVEAVWHGPAERSAASVRLAAK